MPSPALRARRSRRATAAGGEPASSVILARRPLLTETVEDPVYGRARRDLALARDPRGGELRDHRARRSRWRAARSPEPPAPSRAQAASRASRRPGPDEPGAGDRARGRALVARHRGARRRGACRVARGPHREAAAGRSIDRGGAGPGVRARVGRGANAVPRRCEALAVRRCSRGPRGRGGGRGRGWRGAAPGRQAARGALGGK